MKIGFFGGSFNPPTNVHIDIANELIKDNIVDKVIFVPIGDFYSKKDLALFSDRYRMLSFAIERFSNLEIDNFEKNIKQTLYATDAFKLLSKKYKEHEIYFIMGSDNFSKMISWKEYDDIIDKYSYIVVNRNGYNCNESKDNIVYFKPKKCYNYDSTTVRKLIKDGKNIDNFLDHKVVKFIKDNNLYI